MTQAAAALFFSFEREWCGERKKKKEEEGGWEESHDIILKLGRLDKIA